jgi:hypothetical protein
MTNMDAYSGFYAIKYNHNLVYEIGFWNCILHPNLVLFVSAYSKINAI